MSELSRGAALFAVLLVVSLAPAQKLSRDEREILWRQDQRVVGDSALIQYLANKSSRVRRQAAMALANIQDTTAVPHLLRLLQDRYSSVRSAAAFAIGQSGTPTYESEMTERLRQETHPEVIARLLEAIGKTGTKKSYDDVVAFGLPRKLASLKADIAMSVARFAIRGIKSDRGILLCFELLDEEDSKVRSSALYALWRMAPDPMVDDELAKKAEHLTKLSTDKDPDIRMNLATLLGKSRSPAAGTLLQAMVKTEESKRRRDWRVQVNLVRSLASWAPRSAEAMKALVSYLSSENEHVLVSTLTSLGGLSRETVRKHEESEKLQQRLEHLAKPSSRRAESIRGEAMVVLARYFPSQFPYLPILEDAKASDFLRSKVVEAVCQIPTPEHLQVVMDRLQDDSVRVAAAAWEFMRKLLQPRSFRSIRQDTVTRDLGARLFRRAKVTLLREDLALTTLVAMALGDSAIFAFLRNEGYGERAMEELMLAYSKLTSPNDVEAMHAILQTLGIIGDARTIPVLERALEDPDRTVVQHAANALGRITGRDYSSAVPPVSKPVYTDYDWKTLEAIPANQNVEIKTRRGTFVLRLHKAEAPFTVMSFYKLVRKKFYDGLTFHRVVPNFVVQGGDPRGDGWGGPNYAIRSEFSLLGFEKGAVGIASAGKDTEGCQFFVTHSPQPHLDGRYTVFARVVSGTDVVEKLQVGDRIQSIRLKR